MYISLNKGYTLKIMHICAPSSAYEDELVEAFYEEIGRAKMQDERGEK